MKLSFNTLLLLLVLHFPKLFGLKCYSCNPQASDSKTRCGSEQEPVEQECPIQDEKHAFCLIEQSHPEQLTLRAGCQWEPISLIPEPDTRCKPTSYNDENKEASSNVTKPSKECLCKTDLCNTYKSHSLKCWGCKYNSFPYDYKCNDDSEVPTEVRCLLDEDVCKYQALPRRIIGCSRRRKFQHQRDRGDAYNETHSSYCITNNEHTSCFCNTPLCNTKIMYRTVHQKQLSSMTTVTAKSLPLVIILIMSLTLFRPHK